MNRPAPASEARLFPPKELQAFTVILLVLTILCFGAEALASIRRLGYPYNFPFLFFERWTDLYCFRIRFAELHHLAFFSTSPELGVHFMYPAPVALLYGLFYAAAPHTLALFLVLTLSLFGILASIVLRAAITRGLPPLAAIAILGSAVLLGYPFWFEYLLGNMEICIFLIVAFGVLAAFRNHGYTAAALFGIAASMKIFPFVYLALLIPRRMYRQIAFGVFVAILSTLGSLWFVYPSILVSWHAIQRNLQEFKQIYMLRYLPVETGFDHSIFGLFKQIRIHHPAFFPPPPTLLTFYLPIVAAVGIILYFLIIRKLPFTNQLLALTVASILFPPTSHDYTLLHLYTPWAVLLLVSLGAARFGEQIKGLLPAFICFAILLAPQSEFIRHGRGYGGQIKCVTLVVLFFVALRYPFPDALLKPPARA